MVSKWLTKWKCMRLCNFCWQPNPFVTAIYEETILFGEVLQESLDDTSAFDLNNGTAFAKRYWNRTFFLDTGPIEFDEVGERKQPLIIQQFQKDGVWPVTILMLGASAQNFVDVAPVSWSVPFPPLNEPICGYLGTNVLCQKNGISLEYLFFLCFGYWNDLSMQLMYDVRILFSDSSFTIIVMSVVVSVLVVLIVGFVLWLEYW